MAIQNVGNLYQDPLLTNVGSRYKNRKFVADRILPSVSVPSRTFKYLEWDKVVYDLHETKAVPKGSPNQISIAATKKDGTCETHYLSDSIDPQEQEQAGGEIPLATISTETLTDGLLLRKEKTVADTLRDISVLTQNTTLAGSDQWSHADSDPQKAIMARADAMPMKPNILVLGRAVATKLITHAKVREAFRGQALPQITLEWLAAYLELEEIIVGEAFYNSAARGQARTQVSLWGKDAILGYRAPGTPSPLMDQPTLGYTPTVAGAGGANSVRVYTARIGTQGTREGVLWIKAETDYGVLVSAPDNGFLFKAAVA